ncbi:MAG: ATP-binding protein [Candidatus Omnitrophota bacterium]|nr:ATP-binding protein [Candidatus Omnitrophota bacterium]
MFSEPVVGEKFFGREEVLELLNKRTLALSDGYRQNIAITGTSLSGKTSILHHFLHSIREENFITIYIEVIKEPFRSFSNRFIATLLYNALTRTGQAAGFELNGLLDKAQELLPKTYAAIKGVNLSIDNGEFDEAYLNLLGLTSTLKDEIKRSCVVILDEFDNLEYVGVKNPFLNFGKVIMIQKDTMYIVSSSRNQVFKKILSEKLSLLFGDFEIVKVSGFDTQSAKKYIETQISGFDADTALKKFLIAFTDGNPFYLNQILKRAKEVAQDRMTNFIDSDVAVQAITDLIYNANGVIHQYLLNFILDLIDTKYRERYLSILVSIAAGRNKLSDIAKNIRSKQADVSKDILGLSELGFIQKSGVFYKIDDPMLAFWLNKVYQKRREILVGGIFNRLELFICEMKSYISEFILESDKDITDKIARLFNAFSNELAGIGARQIKLPHFTKIEVKESAGQKRFISAALKGKSWVIQAYEEPVRESDIVDYIRNIKSLDCKIINKIIIPLKEIDENAKLLAKELKISMWDLPALNNLLGFYGMIRVVAL